MVSWFAVACKVFRCRRNTARSEQHHRPSDTLSWSSSSVAGPLPLDDPAPEPPRLLEDSNAQVESLSTTMDSDTTAILTSVSTSPACTSPASPVSIRKAKTVRFECEPALRDEPSHGKLTSTNPDEVNEPTSGSIKVIVHRYEVQEDMMQEAYDVKPCADINVPGSEIFSSPVLHLAAKNPSAGPIRSLIRACAKVNEQDEHGITALHISARRGHSEAASALLEGGASISIAADDGSTPLHFVAWSGSVDVLQLFLEANADVEIADVAERTPLHCASAAGHLPVVEALLAVRADPCALDIFNRSPLHAAAYSGNPEVANLLLCHGADRHHRDARGDTPMHIATQLEHYSVLCELSKFSPKSRQKAALTASKPPPWLKAALTASKPPPWLNNAAHQSSFDC